MERRTGADALPGWRETPAKQAVLDFVDAVTAPDSPDFVAEPDRIAVFDNDGTLWTERPVYAQLAFALDRAAELGHPASPDQLRAGGLAALAELVKLTHAGVSTDEFAAVLQWTAASSHRTLQLVVNHTDQDREYAYTRDPVLGSGTDQVLAAAAENKWTVIDMAADWSAVYPPPP